MTEDCVRKGKITHLEMHGADESNLSLRRCTMITLQSIISKVSRSPAHTLYAQGKTPAAKHLSPVEFAVRAWSGVLHMCEQSYLPVAILPWR